MNPVNQSEPKLTKITRTLLANMKQNEHSLPKLSKMNQTSENPVSQEMNQNNNC